MSLSIPLFIIYTCFYARSHRNKLWTPRRRTHPLQAWIQATPLPWNNY